MPPGTVRLSPPSRPDSLPHAQPPPPDRRVAPPGAVALEPDGEEPAGDALVAAIAGGDGRRQLPDHRRPGPRLVHIRLPEVPDPRRPGRRVRADTGLRQRPGRAA